MSEALRRVLPAVATLALLATSAVPAAATTVLDWQVSVTVEPDGQVLERRSLTVRLDAAGDLADISPYPIYLDVNRELETVEVAVVGPDGRRQKIRGRDRFDTVDLAGDGVLHSSQQVRLVDIPPQSAGSVVEIETVTRVEPWFGSGAVSLSPLAAGVPVERLRVEVRGADLRWHLAPLGELHFDSSPGRLVVDGSLDEDSVAGRVLRYAWGPAGSWPAVGGWYGDLVASVPRRPAPVASVARELLGDLETDDRRRTVAALTDYVRRQVRYVAVEVGVGGYRPTPPGETLDRRWGDCKDKSFLLIDLLAEAGVEAFPALVLASDDARVEASFPSADQFNHLIVAVPGDQVPERSTDLRRDGYLFLDPTQDRGELSWLHPAVQGQHALVVRPEASELVTTPVRPDSEARLLTAELAVSEDGSAAGPVMLRLSGSSASSVARAVEDEPRRLEELARLLLQGVADPTELGELSYGEGELDGVPLVEISGAARFARLVTRGRTPSLRLPGDSLLDAEALAELPDADPEPTPVRARQTRAVWRLTFPEGWCMPAPASVELATPVGRFDQTVGPGEAPGEAPGEVVITRHARLDVRWIEPADRAAARELAVESGRVSRRRIRLDCADGG